MTNKATWLKYVILAGLMLVFICLQSSIMAQDTATSEATERPLLMAHYMPWYQTPDVSGYWGWHWTMEFFDPYSIDDEGRPEIASQYMPLTGPYDSQDDAILEYQVLLMKLSGIDGVIVDWYGTAEFRDYAVLNSATGALFEYIQRAGLNFVICYEDATVRNMVNEGFLDGADTIAHGTEIMNYMQENWFSTDVYLRYQDQPMLFIFGPQYFRNPSDWETMSAELETPPVLITLDGHMEFAALSSYPWPPMNMAGGATLAPAALEAYLDLFYRNAQRSEYIVGSAFPAFHDIYAEAGVRSSYGYLDPQNGETLRLTINAALENNANLIQLVTWNDYGEGTIIEPTEEFGYQYLEIVQETRRSLEESDFAFTDEDLLLPMQLLDLRRQFADDAEVNTRLDGVFDAIVAGELESARNILAEFEVE